MIILTVLDDLSPPLVPLAPVPTSFIPVGALEELQRQLQQATTSALRDFVSATARGWDAQCPPQVLSATKSHVRAPPLIIVSEVEVAQHFPS